jgi:hypothetical protein
MNGKEFYTTGEAARLLKISQSTVSRMFDRGILFGKMNPITGKRIVSRESIATLMKHYKQPVEGLTEKKKRILLGTPDHELLSSVQKMFAADDRVQIERFEFGGDVLIHCSMAFPVPRSSSPSGGRKSRRILKSFAARAVKIGACAPRGGRTKF